jgi:hypothetical protein
LKIWENLISVSSQDINQVVRLGAIRYLPGVSLIVTAIVGGCGIRRAGVKSCSGKTLPDFTDDIAGSIPNSAATSECSRCRLQDAGKSYFPR